MDLKQTKYAAFFNEMEKIAKNPVAIEAGKGGMWGAIIGGSAAGLPMYKIMKLVEKRYPKMNPYSAAVIGASMLAGAIAGGKAGGYIGAGMGGAEKVTSHLYNVQHNM